MTEEAGDLGVGQGFPSASEARQGDGGVGQVICIDGRHALGDKTLTLELRQDMLPTLGGAIQIDN
ncbi:hypothetical protein ASG25_11140 [Rhizobium sp. Leaf384]|nr:hypothetical protein ASG25_11140 [Rhizobium sp. Leaf384]KQS82690.1 hypothetical protein ASG58_04955 [Rhizobium sp. Leaf383]